jgi:RNA polymerase sigma-70 factor (ECF subfamily)
LIHSDKEIVEKLKSGDVRAFETIYSQYYRGLFAFASQYVDTADCEEIIQDVMLWLWDKREMLVAELSLKSLLFTAVKNHCLNRVAHLDMRQRVHKQLYDKQKELFENPDLYEESELLDLIMKTISELPAEYRKAFEMSRFENLTYNEIARRTNVPYRTVVYRISHSLKMLKKVVDALEWKTS